MVLILTAHVRLFLVVFVCLRMSVYLFCDCHPLHVSIGLHVLVFVCIWLPRHARRSPLTVLEGVLPPHLGVVVTLFPRATPRRFINAHQGPAGVWAAVAFGGCPSGGGLRGGVTCFRLVST